MKNVRIWFEKKGTCRFISHLDLTRNMTRAIRLARLPVWYTEGFNPRVYMTFAMPLSLGVCGERECMDIRLMEDMAFEEIAARLKERLPEDLPVICVAEPVYKIEEIAFARYELLFETEDSAIFEEKLRRFLSREEIFVIKHTKKGDKEIDIRPDFVEAELTCTDRNHLLVSVLLPCSTSGSVNPALLLEALKRYEELEPFVEITRTGLLLQDFSKFQ